MDSAITCLTITEALDRLSSAPDYVIDGIIPRGSVTILWGGPSLGKTVIATAMAVSVAAGLEFAGKTVTGGFVAYVAAEDPDGVASRFLLAADHVGKDVDLPIGIIGQGIGNLVSDEASDRLGEVIGGYSSKVQLIVVDTLSKAIGRENIDDAHVANPFMANLASLAERFNCGVLVLHHATKTGDKVRGSQALEDAASAVLALKSEKGKSTVTVTKMRNGIPGQGFEFSIVGSSAMHRDRAFDGPVLDQALSVSADLPAQRVENVTQKDEARAILDELLISEKGKVTQDRLRDRCVKHWLSQGKDKGAAKTAFSRALKVLKEDPSYRFSKGLITLKVTPKPRNAECNESVIQSKAHHTPNPTPYRGVGGMGGDTVLTAASAGGDYGPETDLGFLGEIGAAKGVAQ